MWLLLLALPLQGFAAATMINCGPNHHHRMLTSAPAEPASASADPHEHVSAGHHQHEIAGAHDHPAMASGDASGDAPSVQHLDELMKFKCSACAACCMGAAMPTAAVTFEPFPPAMAPDSFVPSVLVGFVTGGPDRPPRLSLV